MIPGTSTHSMVDFPATNSAIQDLGHLAMSCTIQMLSFFVDGILCLRKKNLPKSLGIGIPKGEKNVTPPHMASQEKISKPSDLLESLRDSKATT